MSRIPSPRLIRTPAELAKLLRELKRAVAEGQLEQLHPDPSEFATAGAVADLRDDGPWPDYIELRFRTPDEEQAYKLSVETYHGVGGAWGPE